MNIQARPPHAATSPAEAALWHRQMEEAAATEHVARHHREMAERLEAMANDTEGYWVRVG